MHRKRIQIQKIVLQVTIVFVVILYIFQYISINHRYPKPAIETYNIGDCFYFQGVSMQVLNLKRLNDTDLKRFGALYDKDLYFGEELYCIVPEIRIKNDTSTPKKIDTTILTAESGAWCNGISLSLFTVLNKKDDTLYPTLQPKESITIKLPYTMNVSQFGKHNWKTVASRQYSLVFSLYPVKKTIRLT